MASDVSLVDLKIRSKQLTLINTKLIQIKFKKRKKKKRNVNLIHNRKTHTHVLATQPTGIHVCKKGVRGTNRKERGLV
jgi:hypothetical protein